MIEQSYSQLMKKIKQIQDNLEEKVDSDAFDHEIVYLKAYLEAM